MSRNKREIMEGIECVRSRVVANNTVEYTRENGDRVIRLHLTDIVTFKPCGDIVLDSGGWKTRTTKERMNTFLPGSWYVAQSKSVWYLCRYWDDSDRVEYVYQDGITIKGDGTVDGACKNRKALDRKLRDIKKYVDGYMEELVERKVPKPGGGDCWYCLFKDDNGKTVGDIADRSGHILNHFKGKYYVPSLLMNAIEEFPVSPAAQSAIGYWLGYHDTECVWAEAIGKEQVRRSLVKYLKKRLGLAT